MAEFYKELQLREQCLTNNKEFRSSNQRGKLPLSISALYPDSSNDKQSSRVWCSFCNQNHQSFKCNVVTSSESRKEVLAGFTAEASEVLKHYDDVIRDLKKKNRKLWNQWSKVHYLPHHEVIRVDKDNT